METEVKFILPLDEATQLIKIAKFIENNNLTPDNIEKMLKYGDMLGRVEAGYYPDAKEKNTEITRLLNEEDTRTFRTIHLENSRAYSPDNCGCHIKNGEPDGCEAEGYNCCYGCDSWEPIEKPELEKEC